MLFRASVAVLARVRRSTDPLTKTNDNGLWVEAFLSHGLKAFVWHFNHPARQVVSLLLANNVKHFSSNHACYKSWPDNFLVLSKVLMVPPIYPLSSRKMLLWIPAHFF